MSGVMWSGPGKALQAHLGMFERVDRTRNWMISVAGREVTQRMLESAPDLFRQRARLMTTMADNIGITVVQDGHTMSDQDHPQAMATQRNLLRASSLINTEHELLNQGETHYVSHHIVAAVEAAAEAADDEPLFPTDLPCPHGLMVFEYPLILPDLHPTTGVVMDELRMPIRAIGWSTQTVQVRNRDTGELEPHPGIFYALYTDQDAWKALFLPSVKEHLPDEYDEYQPLYDGVETTHDPMWCIDSSGWAFGTSWKRGGNDLPREAFEQGQIHDMVARVRRFILAMWRFEWARILVPQVHKPSRAEHRQAARAGRKLEDGYVKVLRLRRHVEAEARGEHISGDQLVHDCQWMVRGHPRRQWFPSLGPARNPDGSFNADSHRLMWIEPHTKGNPYAPLRVGHNVTAVVR
jgi:hypothetical protein